MKNSIYAIRNREYFLYTPDNKFLQKYKYRETHITYSLRANNKKYHISEVDRITGDKRFEINFADLMETPLEKWFWKNTTAHLKKSLMFSYWLRYHKNHKKIPNVETENWTLIPAFNSIRQSFLDQFQMRNIKHPRTIINSIIRTTGKHRMNLRMGHVHLSMDDLKGRIVYGIHWDTSAVELSLKLPLHWLMDDIPS